MLTDFLYLAFRNIRYRKRRTLLTVIGIFIGIMAVVALVSLGQGLQNSVQQEFEQIGSDKLFINPGGDQTQGQITTSIKLTSEDLDAVRNTKGVDSAAGIVFISTPATVDGEQSFVTLLGMPDENQDIVEASWAIEIGEGRKIRSTDKSNIVIGSQVANSLFTDELGLRSQLEIQGEKFRVVGVMEPTGDPGIDRSVIMSLQTTQRITGREEGRYDWIFAEVQPGFAPSEVQKDIEKNLRRSRDVDEDEEDFTVSTQEELLESFNSILGVVRGVVIGIASISLLVGGIGIMNTMYTSVTQRTREIGVMKAIGATNRQIMVIFLLESGIIGLVGGVLGVVTGLGVSVLATFGATQATNIQINPFISPALIVGSLIFAFLIGTISGILPARRAAGLPPAEALRYE